MGCYWLFTVLVPCDAPCVPSTVHALCVASARLGDAELVAEAELGAQTRAVGGCSDGASVSSKAEAVACCCSILCEVAAHEARTGLTLGERSRRSTSVAIAHRVSCCPPSCGTPNKPHNSFITKSNRFRSLIRFSSSSICIPHKACQTLLSVSSHVLSTCAAHAQMIHLLHNTILHHFVPRVQPCHILSMHAVT